jgi:hypothetical protein
MSYLIARADNQLRRIDEALAQLRRRPQAEQRKLIHLVTALRSERTEILRLADPRERTTARQ